MAITKRLNQGIEDYICCYVWANQTDWVDHVDKLEFCYNAAINSTTGFSPFEIATGKEVLTPIGLIQHKDRRPTRELDIDKFLETWKQKMETAEAILNKTKTQMIARVNKKREHVEFFPGDLVLVSASS